MARNKRRTEWSDDSSDESSDDASMAVSDLREPELPPQPETAAEIASLALPQQDEPAEEPSLASQRALRLALRAQNDIPHAQNIAPALVAQYGRDLDTLRHAEDFTPKSVAQVAQLLRLAGHVTEKE